MPTVSNVCVCVECTPWSHRDPFGLVIRDFFTFFLLQQGAAAAAVREREEERERERREEPVGRSGELANHWLEGA